jgi:hypothetical protein
MAEDDRATKRSRNDGGTLTLLISEDGRVGKLTWVFECLPCADPQCETKGLFADDGEVSERATHKLVLVDIPSHRIGPVGITEAELGPDKGEFTPFHVCPIWLAKYNNVERFERVKKEWRYACQLLLREHAWLRPALQALQLFGRRYLIGPALKLTPQ